MSSLCSVKKTINLLLFVLILILTVNSAPVAVKQNRLELYAETSSDNKKRTVIIDAGHGGEDVGAIGVGEVYEKDLNMQISNKLGEYLSAAGYDVVYTRTEDCLLYTEEQNIKGMRKIYDLKNRIAIANSYSDALFISIHMNYFGQPSCSGLQVYHADDKFSKALAESVQSSVKNTLQPANRRTVKSGEDIYVLKNSTVTSILIECGFISNPDECKKLSEKEYQKELCFSILCGIIEYEKGQ